MVGRWKALEEVLRSEPLSVREPAKPASSALSTGLGDSEDSIY